MSSPPPYSVPLCRWLLALFGWLALAVPPAEIVGHWYPGTLS